MIPFLILGVLLGIVSVLFFLENVTSVTVMFLNWQMTGSLAIVLLLAVMSGIAMTLLVLLPSLIRDELYLSSVKRHKKEVEDELANTKHALVEAKSHVQTPEVMIVEKAAI